MLIDLKPMPLPRRHRRNCDRTAHAATPDSDLASPDISHILADQAANLAGGEGEIAVLAGNSGDAFEAFRSRLVAKHPAVDTFAILFGDDDEDRAFCFTRNLLKFRPSVNLIVSLSPFSMRGAAAAVRASKLRNLRVIGPGLPRNDPH